MAEAKGSKKTAADGTGVRETQVPVKPAVAEKCPADDIVCLSRTPGWYWFECRRCHVKGEPRESTTAALEHILSLHGRSLVPTSEPPTGHREKEPDAAPARPWLCHNCGLWFHAGTQDKHAKECARTFTRAKAAEPAVDHPAHYKAGNLEAITVIEALGHGHGFCVGNALKYLWRAGKKTPDALEDLRKARWYVDRAIAALEKGGG